MRSHSYLFMAVEEARQKKKYKQKKQEKQGTCSTEHMLHLPPLLFCCWWAALYGWHAYEPATGMVGGRRWWRWRWSRARSRTPTHGRDDDVAIDMNRDREEALRSRRQWHWVRQRGRGECRHWKKTTTHHMHLMHLATPTNKSVLELD